MALIRACSVAGLLLLIASAASAQEVAARSFEQLQVLVRTGDTVVVTDTGGNRIRGTVATLTDDALTLDTGAGRQGFSEPDVRSITQRRGDPLHNGAWWGLAAGAAFATTALVMVCQGENCGPALYAIAIPVYGGLGAAVGVGVDALIRGNRTVFSPTGGSASVFVVPSIGKTTGVSLGVRF